MSESLAGKTAVVTGAASGIGRAIAERLGEEGASIVVADVDEEGASESVRDLEEQGVSALACRCDVSDVEDAVALADTVVDEFGSLDVLVNNAGTSSRGTFDELEPEQWNRVLDINLTGMFNCCYALVPELKKSDSGRIVNISSTAGRNISYYGGPDYTASKWGVIGLTKHLAWELGADGITVNAVCPGPTLTDRFEEHTSEEVIRSNEEKVPVGRMGSPEDQANAVASLASEEAA